MKWPGDAEIAAKESEDADSFAWLKRSRTPVLSYGGAQLERPSGTHLWARAPLTFGAGCKIVTRAKPRSSGFAACRGAAAPGGTEIYDGAASSAWRG